MVTETIGDVIQSALDGEIDVIVHGANCYCRMKRGIAVDMAREFGCNRFDMESPDLEGDINKLGQIDFKYHKINVTDSIWVINAYTQYHWHNLGKYGIPLDYDAFRLCFRKINMQFEKSKVGVPGLIGAGLAGGNPKIIKQILKEECTAINLIIFYPQGADL